MKKSGFFKKYLALLFSLLIISSLFFSISTVAYAGEIIKVGFFQFDGYHNIDKNGNKSGYGYEFIQEVLRYNNFTAQYIGYENNWSQMQDMLENGDIDVLTSAQKTPERELKFDFSSSIGTSAAVLSVKAENSAFVAGEYNTYNGMRVGVIKDNSRNDSFEKFAKQKGFSYSFVYYDDMDKLTSDLQKGIKIDAIVTSNLRIAKNEWTLDKFGASPFYAMVKKGNTELLKKINFAIEQANINSIDWQDKLFQKYYAGTNSSTIGITSTERKYLKELKSFGKRITVVINPDRSPYSYMENEKAVGIIPEIFEEVANRLDLDYEYINCTTREEYQNIIKSGQADVILDRRTDYSDSEKLGIN